MCQIVDRAQALKRPSGGNLAASNSTIENVSLVYLRMALWAFAVGGPEKTFWGNPAASNSTIEKVPFVHAK